ncbi:MAG: hypothetical protein PHI66_01515 [Candidatus Pacebacteria bacterium]|nr:hypothetical protein [Candidatus Paceibacterota bacterium]
MQNVSGEISPIVGLAFVISYVLALYIGRILLQTKRGDRFFSVFFRRTEKECKKRSGDLNIGKSFTVHFSRKRELLFIFACLILVGISYLVSTLFLSIALGMSFGMIHVTDMIIAYQEAELIYKIIPEKDFHYISSKR